MQILKKKTMKIQVKIIANTVKITNSNILKFLIKMIKMNLQKIIRKKSMVKTPRNVPMMRNRLNKIKINIKAKKNRILNNHKKRLAQKVLQNLRNYQLKAKKYKI